MEASAELMAGDWTSVSKSLQTDDDGSLSVTACMDNQFAVAHVQTVTPVHQGRRMSLRATRDIWLQHYIRAHVDYDPGLTA